MPLCVQEARGVPSIKRVEVSETRPSTAMKESYLADHSNIGCVNIVVVPLAGPTPRSSTSALVKSYQIVILGQPRIIKVPYEPA